MYESSAEVFRAAGIDLDSREFDHAPSVLKPILRLPAERAVALVRFFSDPTFGCQGQWLEHLFAQHPEAVSGFDPATAHHNLEFAREIGIDAFPALVWDVPLRMTALLDLNEFFDAFQDLGVSYDTTKLALQPTKLRSLFGYSRSPQYFVNRLRYLSHYFGVDLIDSALRQHPPLILVSQQTMVVRLTILSLAGVYQHAIQNPHSPVFNGLLALLCTNLRDFVSKTGFSQAQYTRIANLVNRHIGAAPPDLQAILESLDFTPQFQPPEA